MKLDISRVATLANLPLSKEEIEKLAPQLEETLEYIDQLNEVDTKNVKPTSQVTGLENVMAEDTVTPSLTQAEALSNTTAEYNHFFKVKGIFTDE
jgi:aspartyl-tRNA(Asn)/glutamyl-tRNA(Gln) amidotransferase subunit C